MNSNFSVSKYQNKNFEDCYEFEGLLEDIEDRRKAVIVLQVLSELLTDKTNDINLHTFDGRRNLYCLLLMHHFGEDLVKKILESYGEENEKGSKYEFRAATLLNTVCPDSFEEMQLRIKEMYSASTDVHTIAFESGKRMTLTMMSELNLELTYEPIKSFFNLPRSAKLQHRITPNTDEAAVSSTEMNKLIKAYYSKIEVPIRTRFYPMPSGAPGMTMKLTKVTYDYSANLAEDNSRTQEKDINSYLVEALTKLSGHTFLFPTVVRPSENNLAEKIQEKSIEMQYSFLRRLFIEKLADLGTNTKATSKVKDLCNLWFDEAKKRLNAVHDGRSIADGLKEKITDWEGVWKKKKKNDPQTEKSEPSEIGGWKELLKKQRQKRDTDPKFFADETNYDALLENNLSFPLLKEGTWSEARVTDPKSLEFAYAHMLMCHNNGSSLTELPLTFDTKWAPRDYHILLTTICTSVHDLASLQALIKLVDGNGRKRIAGYKGGYFHDSHKSLEFNEEVRNRNSGNEFQKFWGKIRKGF